MPVELGDPYVLVDDKDKFYMYGTGGVDNAFDAYSSNDLVNWQVYSADNKNSWGIGDF